MSKVKLLWKKSRQRQDTSRKPLASQHRQVACREEVPRCSALIRPTVDRIYKRLPKSDWDAFCGTETYDKGIFLTARYVGFTPASAGGNNKATRARCILFRVCFAGLLSGVRRPLLTTDKVTKTAYEHRTIYRRRTLHVLRQRSGTTLIGPKKTTADWVLSRACRRTGKRKDAGTRCDWLWTLETALSEPHIDPCRSCSPHPCSHEHALSLHGTVNF
jgi:hypothetical protein